MDDLWGVLPLIAIVVVAIMIHMFLARRNKPETQRTIVQNVLMDIRINQTILDLLEEEQIPKRFSENNWKLNRNRIDFLPDSLQTDLCNTFDMVDDINQQIQMARKDRSPENVNDIDMEQLIEPLARCRQRLEDWLMAHGGPEDGPPIRYPSITDTLFGSGR